MKAGCRIAVLIACCFAGAVMASQPPAPVPAKPAQENQHKAAPNENKTESKQEAPEPESSGVDKGSTAPTTAHTKETAKNRGSEPPRDWWSIVASALTLFFSGCLVALMFLQWLAMVRQAGHMRDTLEETRRAADAAAAGAASAKLAAEAANASAEAAQESNQIAAQAFELAYRAYVFIESIDTAQNSGAELIEVEVRFRNYGPGPARDVRIECFAEMVREGAAAPFTEVQLVPSTGNLAPKQRFGFSVFFTAEMRDAFYSPAEEGIDKAPASGDDEAQNRARFIVGGNITYKDVSDQVRTTRFCWEYLGSKEWGLVPGENTFT